MCTALVSKGRELDFPVAIHGGCLEDAYNRRSESARVRYREDAFQLQLSKESQK